jgi:hypothetical protein
MPNEPIRTDDRDAIFQDNDPFDPTFMDEAITTIMRNLPLDPQEPRGSANRRMHSALRSLSALHPRDETEVMLGVQALCAYHAAAACWRIGMNLRQPHGDSTRHITTAATAARTYDTMLRAIERRQAKPLSIPIGRPESRAWPTPDMEANAVKWEDRCAKSVTAPEPEPEPEDPNRPPVTWTPEQVAYVAEFRDRERIEKENEGLDIANTEGILPGGGMILPEDPTPQQAAYMGRRLKLMYLREIAENRRLGITTKMKIRPIRTGDLIP